MTDDEGEGGDYEIGYGKPPKNQFPKGTSGNPKGRPKGVKNKKSVFSALMEERVVTDGSKGLGSMNMREAIWRTLIHKALKEKDPRTLKILVELDIRYSGGLPDRQARNDLLKENARLKKELEECKARGPGGVLVVPAGGSLEPYLVEAEQQRQVMLKHQESYGKELKDRNEKEE